MADSKILVVDDEPQILLLVSRFLTREGYEVETAPGGKEALEHLAESPFVLVLSDLKMPHLDGIGLLEQVRERYPDTIFILMTAFGTIDSAVSVLRRGAYDYLTKPLDLEDLVSTVSRALEHRRVVTQNKRLMEFLQEKNVVLEYLHREEQRKSEMLNQVNAIARRITSILDQEVLLATVVSLVLPAFGMERMDFGLVDGDVLNVHVGDRGVESLLLGKSEMWQLTEGGELTWHRLRALGTPPQTPYDMVYPLRAGERLVGFWGIAWAEDIEHREENLPYLEAVAAQTVTALENARLYALARRADEMAFLNRVGSAANHSLDLEETIYGVLSCIQSTLQASMIEICLCDPSHTTRQVYSLVGGQFQSNGASALDETFIERVRAEAMAVCDPREAARFFDRRQAGRVRSLLGVLLLLGQRQIGILSVGSDAEEQYDMEDARLLQVVGAQVSTAIENARLFQEVLSGRQTILQSRNTLLALFDGILEGIYIVDQDSAILAINRTQARWAGREVRDLIGAFAESAFPDSEYALALVDETFRTGEPASHTERQRVDDARSTEWAIQTYPVFLSDPDEVVAADEPTPVDRVVVVVRDVTEQRLLEASLSRSEKLASVGRLAAGIAHEINNPMTVISANAQILSEEIAAEHPYFGSIELIDRAAERASRIVRNLLDFSRVEQFDFQQIDVNHSLHEAVLMVAAQVRQAKGRIIADLATSLPPIWASADHLHVVWLNLLLNARDAIAETDREGLIEVSSFQRGEDVIVRVSDNGIGIPTHRLERIYDPFFTTKDPGKGTGLGLFTCYRTIHRHGGTIVVDSEDGLGTRFDVVLPVRKEPTWEILR